MNIYNTRLNQSFNLDCSIQRQSLEDMKHYHEFIKKLYEVFCNRDRHKHVFNFEVETTQLQNGQT